ncbi:hypothetical protein AKUH3B110M_TOXIN200200 (plasmid) [Apilactobacillus kunkeei]|nr:hypothetical protein AKUH3B207X_TOXIN200150 [Apilactobacillus kunkeei]CAI2676635.1 hypothetical protein AKUH3B110M_TOXIN200200 [Apilactobacillus kunkeei]CAI2699322.1 hypothetical protein AKUH4B507J_TOXIN200130 [Apilactobacillus kunkeei]CAI2699342.1 hypothetical protein AKUH3B103J_TOXIN200140 [Apilactobacillus kunkeei]
MSMKYLKDNLLVDSNDNNIMRFDKELAVQQVLSKMITRDLRKQLNNKEAMNALREYSKSQTLMSLVPYLNKYEGKAAEVSYVLDDGTEYIQYDCKG